MYTLLCGDARKVLDEIEDGSVSCIYTSPNPPFFEKNKETDEIGSEKNFVLYMNRLMEVFEKLRTKLKETGSMFVHAGDYHTVNGSMLQVPERIASTLTDKYKWILRSKIIWWRPDKSIQEDYTRFKRDWEYLYWFTKTGKGGYQFIKPESDRLLSSSVFKVPYILPSPKYWDSGYPEELVRIPLKVTTKEGDLVLDCFCGTGTTGLVAVKMKRNFIGIDIIPWKVEKTRKRFDDYYMKLPNLSER